MTTISFILGAFTRTAGVFKHVFPKEQKPKVYSDDDLNDTFEEIIVIKNIENNLMRFLKNKRGEIDYDNFDFKSKIKINDLFKIKGQIRYKKLTSYTKNGISYEYYCGKGLWGYNSCFFLVHRNDIQVKKSPVVIALHGHGLSAQEIIDEDVFIENFDDYKNFLYNKDDALNMMYGLRLARMGYIVISPVVAFGTDSAQERQIATLLMTSGYSLLSFRVYNFLNMISFVSRNFPYKMDDIAAVGWSMGGYLALWLGVLTPEVNTVALSATFSTMEDYGKYWQNIETIQPGILQYADMIDMVKVCLKKGKNVFIQRGKKDLAYTYAKRDLDMLSSMKNENLQIDVNGAGHVIHGESLFKFVAKHLPLNN